MTLPKSLPSSTGTTGTAGGGEAGRRGGGEAGKWLRGRAEILPSGAESGVCTEPRSPADTGKRRAQSGGSIARARFPEGGQSRGKRGVACRNYKEHRGFRNENSRVTTMT